MALNFPSGVSVGYVYTYLGKSWTWDGSIWIANNVGVQGAQGTQGSLGAQGTNGSQGTSGTNGSQGASGSQGANGTSGAQGTTGSQGTSGTNGTNGANGSQGATGSQGTSGTNGSQGSTGAQGATGSTGSTGSTGAQGTTGATGAQGTSGATILGNNNAFTGANTFPSISVANSGAGHDPYGAIGVTMPSASNYSYYGLTRSGVIGCAIGIDTSNNMWFGQAGSGYSGTRTAAWFYGNSSGDLYGTGSVRAPVFYDSDNTNYYVNPNGGSVLSSLNFPAGGQTINTTTPGTGAYQLNFTGQSTSDYAQAITWGWSTSGAQAGIYVQSSGNYGTKMYFATTDSFATGSKTSMSIDHGGTIQVPRSYLQSNSSLRAPIFYDSDNTGYYMDPASGSIINSITIAGQINQTGPGRTATISTSNYDSKIGSSDLYLYTKSIEGGNYPVAVQVFRVSDGLTNWPIAFQPVGGNVTIGSYSDYGYKLGVNGVGYSNSSWRAPIFYDSDDTGYYIDPNSTSDTALRVRGGILHGPNPTWGAYLYVGTNGNISGNATVAVTNGNIHIDTAGSGYPLYLQYYCGGYTQAYGSMRAPIYYDVYDTNYYCDPNSTSRLSAVNADNYYAYTYYRTQYVGRGGICGLYDSTKYQNVFTMGDSWNLASDGSTVGNLYGMSWSHPNAGGVAGNLDSHGMIVHINGGFASCMSYSIKASSNVTAYSDERLKKDWSDLPKNYIEELAKVKVGTYTRIDGEKLRQVGISAQSLRPLLPEAVIEATDDFKTLSVAYGNAAMASAVELAKEVVTLKEQLNIVMERLKQLENK